ncbi:hypothetical protein SprV_0200616900 [Sparganum proliferum]
MAVSLVNTAVSSPRQRPSALSKQLPSCYRCGQHHIRWSDCRHQKTVCQICKKIGHIERVCFSKRRANTNTHATYPNPAEDGEAILRMFSANALLQSPYTITLPVDHHPVKFEIDTGSAVTLINEASLQKLPSLLPASSTFLPVLKFDGSVRICGDSKLTINSATKLNPYPLPRIEDLYASLAGGHQFTTLDLKHAYNQVVLDTESRDATTIYTHRGLFRYKDYHLEAQPGKRRRKARPQVDMPTDYARILEIIQSPYLGHYLQRKGLLTRKVLCRCRKAMPLQVLRQHTDGYAFRFGLFAIICRP